MTMNATACILSSALEAPPAYLTCRHHARHSSGDFLRHRLRSHLAPTADPSEGTQLCDIVQHHLAILDELQYVHQLRSLLGQEL